MKTAKPLSEKEWEKILPSGKSKIKLNEQHDYVTIRTPNGNFTGSYSGFKASGRLAGDKTGAFDRMVKFVESEANGKTMGDRMKNLADEKVLSTLWTDWDKEEVNPFQVNDSVIMPLRPAYGKGVVTEVKKKNCVVRFLNRPLTKMDCSLLQKA